jgi:hypothetical protein
VLGTLTGVLPRRHTVDYVDALGLFGNDPHTCWNRRRAVAIARACSRRMSSEVVVKRGELTVARFQRGEQLAC